MFGGIKVKSLHTELAMASRNQYIVEEDYKYLVFRGRSDFTHGYIAAVGDDASSAHFAGTTKIAQIRMHPRSSSLP